MENKICNEILFDAEKWKQHFIFNALAYDGKDSETPVSLMPLLFMFLYSRNQLNLVRNIKLFYKEYDVLHFVDYSVVVQNSDFEKFSFSQAESEEFADGVFDKALVSTMEEDDPYYETMVFITHMKNQYLENEKIPFNEYWKGFDFYNLLMEVTPEFIKENYLYLFSEIARQNRFLHKSYMYNSFLKTQKSHYELSKLMIKLLDIKEGVVVQPYADFGYTLNALPQGVSYSASFDDPLAMHLVRLLGAGSKGEFVVTTLNTLPKELPEYEFDYLLWNPQLHMKREIEDYENLFDIIIGRAPEKFKAACLLRDTFWLSQSKIAEYCLLNYVYKIIFFRNSMTLALFDKDIRKREKRIVIVNETVPFRISADFVLRDLEEGKNQYVVDDWDLRMAGFQLDINTIVRRQLMLKGERGKRLVRLSRFLKEQRLRKIPFWTTKEQGGIDCKSNRDFYTFYMPFVSAENSQPLPDDLFYAMKSNNAMAFELDKRMLLVNLSDRDRFQPRFFDDSKGKALLYFNSSDKIAAFEVDESVVDVEYLVAEIKKEYFIKQLFPTRGYVRNKADDFLSLRIQIPDCETSVERQKNLFKAEKLEYIKSLAASLGYDIEKMVANKERAPLPNGTMLLKGKYRIDSFLGHGGFGKTYRATEYVHIESRTRKIEIVIKEFFIDSCQRRNAGSLSVETPCEKIEQVIKAQRKFMNEARKIKQFSDHPHIVNVYDVFDENGTCYYTMEYFEGLSLEDYVESREMNALEEEEAVRIISEVASALEVIHDHGMNHLDVKPSNILINELGKALLIDFGTAHSFNASCDESSYFPIYSDGYSPLEISTLSGFSPATDIYSLAATLYRIVSGEIVPSSRELFSDMNCLKRPEEISSNTWEAILKGLSPNVNDRPQSIKEFLNLL